MHKDPNSLQRTVYLLNPISGHGHLDSWARIFTAAFLELGHRVVLVTQQQDGLASWLERRKVGDLGRLRITSPYVEPEIEDEDNDTSLETPGDSRPLKERIARIYRKEGFRGLGFRIKRRFLYYSQIVWFFCTKWIYRYKNHLRIDVNFISPLMFTQSIKNCIDETKWQPDLIFILYLDMLTRNRHQWEEWEKQLPYVWGGIQFSPSSNRINPRLPLDTWFTRSYFLGACFLLDEASSFYKNLLPKKTFSTIPDITDVERLSSPSQLMNQIMERSAGRTIIFAGGTLDVRKGLATLAQVILQAPASDFFFLIVGRIYWETYDAETAGLLRSVFENPPENVFAHLQFVEDEREFTSLMGLADIIYAVYNNFPYSSNMLSKAAHLERPLIVSDGYEMGRRVKEYGLGFTVPEGDAEAILKALIEVRQREFAPGNFASYRKDNSFEALQNTLQEFLTGCLDGAEISHRRQS